MWTSESFATLELLVAFLNDRRLRASQCLLVAGENANGPVFHLLYHDLEEDAGPRTAAMEADLVPVVEAGESEEADAAVGAAEAILKESNRP